MVNGAVRCSLPSSALNPRLQNTHVDAIERETANRWQKAFEPAYIVPNAPLVPIFEHELRSSLLKSSRRPDSVKQGLSRLLHQSCEELLRFLNFTCFSALANSPPADAFVDVPDSGPLDESG
jgi:hypothetical protein